MSDGFESDSFEARIVYLEESMCHDQRLLAELNQVIVSLRDEVDRLHRKLAVMDRRMEHWDQRIQSQESDLPHEKPPHY
jgi:uncharacterized coiled-coil protein SlyX